MVFAVLRIPIDDAPLSYGRRAQSMNQAGRALVLGPTGFLQPDDPA